MSWQCGQRIVAEPTGATVSGTSVAGGAQVHIDVAFRLLEWPSRENGPASLVPQPSEVVARLAQTELPLGFALPDPMAVLRPALQSSTGSIRFTLPLTTQALVALEAARDGGPLALFMKLVAHPFVVSHHAGYAPGIDLRPTVREYVVPVPRDQWLNALKTVGYGETLITELPLPQSGPATTSAGRERLVKAVSARNEGRYRNTVQDCRIALDSLKTAGFGGRAPEEVAQFLQKNARSLSPAERFSALQTAMQLFLSPAHHDGVADEEFSREDADLVIAMTAALLRLAPRWSAEPKEGA
jgi:hypothetical protein